MNFQERIDQARQSQGKLAASNNNDLADGFSSEFYGTEGIRNPIACLDLRFADGSRKAVPYSYILEMSFDTESIEIITSGKVIKITGRDLARLYDYLTAYRVKYIQENLGMDAGISGLLVEKVSIQNY